MTAHEVLCTRIVVLGPVKGGKSTLVNFIAANQPDAPLTDSGSDASSNFDTSTTCSEPAVTLHRVRVDPTKIQFGLCEDGGQPRSLSSWINSAEASVAQHSERSRAEAYLDILENCTDRFTLQPMPASSEEEALDARLALEIIEVPGIKDKDPNRERNLTEALDKICEVGGRADVIVLVIRHTSPMNQTLLDPLKYYLKQFSMHARHLLVVHSRYDSAHAAETNSYLDLSGRIAAFNSWMQNKTFGDGLNITHVAMNNKVSPALHSYPAQVAFCYQQLNAFLSEIRSVTEANTEALSISSRLIPGLGQEARNRCRDMCAKCDTSQKTRRMHWEMRDV
ncbi:hypothetical protein, variant [Allomyces macrogynus ATCC 38327]|uniref:G domain-containing protein n=1 Tax=Allomyces macrogynus (strain ATCC 38327) TaxID=578462 RepID=A0A0L0S7K4_ALLM3|nr:hypothetical protein, variant [Allomyces macrogynus ATCC 38327]|eukprot:KNE58405.1 hypothetical protein, variant [Allomyces macrogynus ATCC 38327]